MSSMRMAGLAVFMMVLLAAGCRSAPSGDTRLAAPGEQPAPEAPVFEAGGIYGQCLRVRVAPHDVEAFETLMKRCVVAAKRAGLPESHEWLSYREPPGRYWFVSFSDTVDGFIYPRSFEGFVATVAAFEGEAAREEVMRMLESIDYETEWWILSRQKKEWSTVGDMSTATHPMGRMMMRTIRPGREREFEAALAARTAFLDEHGYPLPIEGFVTVDAEPPSLRRTEMQLVFPVDWPSFHERQSFGAFVETLEPSLQEEYARRKAALLETMSRAEYHDGAHAPDLRFYAD